ncbi:MAG: hypothetical protein HFJ59_00410 [Clostridia bacterium]|nr:hypothetical protein [Clostridia bacterium]
MKAAKKIQNIDDMILVLMKLNPNQYFEKTPVLFGAEYFIQGNISIESLNLPQNFCYEGNRLKPVNSHELDGFVYEF